MFVGSVELYRIGLVGNDEIRYGGEILSDLLAVEFDDLLNIFTMVVIISLFV